MRVIIFISAAALILLQKVFASTGAEAAVGKKKDGRVTPGKEVEPKFKYPFVVRIFHDKNQMFGTNATICGGFIISRDWIVTAAHCVRAAGNNLLYAVGEHHVFEKEESEQVLRAKKVINHERYRSGTYPHPYDIAVVQVTPPIRFNHRVAPINLPTCKSDPSYPDVIVAGWGQHGSEIPTSALIEGSLRLVPLADCQKAALEEDKWNTTLQHQICTVDGPDSPGPGDSGSPLFQLREKDNIHSGYVVLGVVSFGAGKHHEVYTKVSNFVGWIHRRTSGCGNHPWSPYFSNNTIGTPFPPGGK